MDKTLIESLYQFKDMIAHDERIILLNQYEKEMMDDDEVMKLTYNKDECNRQYEDVLRFHDEMDECVKEKRNKLITSKDKLYSHPLVKRYLKQYNEVNNLYIQINEIIFANFTENFCIKEK